MDERLREAAKAKTMNAKLAQALYDTIRRCRVFVFVASKNSASSGWMPWELGLAQGAVGRVHLYLLDRAAKDAAAGREYLKLRLLQSNNLT